MLCHFSESVTCRQEATKICKSCDSRLLCDACDQLTHGFALRKPHTRTNIQLCQICSTSISTMFCKTCVVTYPTRGIHFCEQCIRCQHAPSADNNHQLVLVSEELITYGEWKQAAGAPLLDSKGIEEMEVAETVVGGESTAFTGSEAMEGIREALVFSERSEEIVPTNEQAEEALVSGERLAIVAEGDNEAVRVEEGGTMSAKSQRSASPDPLAISKRRKQDHDDVEDDSSENQPSGAESESESDHFSDFDRIYSDGENYKDDEDDNSSDGVNSVASVKKGCINPGKRPPPPFDPKFAREDFRTHLPKTTPLPLISSTTSSLSQPTAGTSSSLPSLIPEEQLSAEDVHVFSNLRQSEPSVHPKATIYVRMEDNPCFVLAGDRTPSSSAHVEHLARIRKALHLGLHTGTKESEAQHAMQLATRLMAKYNITSEQLEGAKSSGGSARRIRLFKNYPNEPSRREPIKQWPPGTWITKLALLVCELFAVQFYTSSSETKKAYVFYGVTDQVDQACLTFEMVVNKAITISREENKSQDHSFLLGFAERLYRAEKDALQAQTSEERSARKKAVRYSNEACDRVSKAMKLKLIRGRESRAKVDRQQRARGDEAAKKAGRVLQKMIA